MSAAVAGLRSIRPTGSYTNTRDVTRAAKPNGVHQASEPIDAVARIAELKWPAMPTGARKRTCRAGVARSKRRLEHGHRRVCVDDLAAGGRPWLLQIATNLLRDELRARARRRTLVERLRGERPSPVALPAGADPDLVAALATLRRDELDVLLLFAWAELSYAARRRSSSVLMTRSMARPCDT